MRQVIEEMVVRITGDITRYNQVMHQFEAVTKRAMSRAQGVLAKTGVMVDTFVLGIGHAMNRARMHIQRGFLQGLLAAPAVVNSALASMRRGFYNFSLGVSRGLAGAGVALRTFAGRAGQLLGGGARGIGRGLSMAGGMGLAGLMMAGRGIGAGAAAAGRGAVAAGRGVSAMGGAAMGLGSRALGGALGGGMAMAGGMLSAFSVMRSAANTTVSYISKRFRTLGYDLAYVGRKLSMYITAPIIAIGTASVKTFAKFDDALQTSIAVMGGVSEEMNKALTKMTFDISAGSRTSPTDIALGYFHLASAGYKAADALSAVATVEKFSVAGAFDLNESGHAAGNSLFAMARATNFLVDSQAALGLKTDDVAQNMKNMTHIGDVLTKANIISNATVQDFAKALTNKGAAAIRLLNKDVEEGVAVLAAFASQGVKAETAGEKLYIITRDLARATIKHREAWDGMNIRVFDATGNMRHLADIVSDMEKALGGMADEEKRAALMHLGLQDRSLAATIQLMGMSDAIRKFDNELRNSAGSMQKVADIRLKSFTSQMMMLRNQITVVAIGIGQMLVPYIMQMNEQIKKAIGYWNELNEPFKRWALTLTLVAAAIGPTILGMGVMMSTIFTMKSIVMTMTGLFMAWIPVVGIIAGVAAGIAGLIYLIGGKEGLVGAWEYAKGAISNFFLYTVGFLENFTENMTRLWTWLKAEWWNVLKDVGQFFLVLGNNFVHNTFIVVETVVRLWNTALGWIAMQWEYLFTKKFALYAQQGFLNVLIKALDFAVGLGEMIDGALKGAFTSGSSGAKKAMSWIDKMAMDLMKGAGEAIKGKGLTETLEKVLGEQKGKLKSPLEGFESNVKTAPGFITKMGDAAEKAAPSLERVTNAVVPLRDESEDEIRFKVSLQGVDAVEARSAKFMRMWMEYKSQAGQGIDVNAGPRTRADILSGRRKAHLASIEAKQKAHTGPIGARRQKELDRRARMRKFLAEQRTTTGSYAGTGDSEAAFFASQGELPAPAVSNKAENVVAQAKIDPLVETMRALILAIEMNTAATEGTASVEIVESDLSGS